MREILPAATATVTFAKGKAPEGAPAEVTVATVLPLAWPGLHRADGTVFVGTQSGVDLRRRVAATSRPRCWPPPPPSRARPVASTPAATAESPRLQDLLDTDGAVRGDRPRGLRLLGRRQRARRRGQGRRWSAPTSRSSPPSKMAAAPSAYWCRIGERTHIRLVLPEDEDIATDALARLHAAGDERPRRRRPGCSARSAPAACSCRCGTSSPSKTVRRLRGRAAASS